MNGHGEKLTRKQEQAISALLSCSTIKKAADAVGVAETTLRRWLQEDAAFLVAYRQARRRVVEAAVGLLQRATGKAVRTLVRNMDGSKASDQIRAAAIVIEQA